MSQRRIFTAAFKCQVALEAIREKQTLSELSAKCNVHPSQILAWKKELLERGQELYEKSPSSTERDQEKKISQLYKVIGKIEAERDFLAEASAKLSGRRGGV